MPGIGEDFLLSALSRNSAALGNRADTFLSIANQEAQQKNAAFRQLGSGVVDLVTYISEEDKKQKAKADEIALTDIKLKMERDQQDILAGMQQRGYDPADPFTVETARKYRDQTYSTYEANNPNLSEDAKARLKIWWTSQDTGFVGATQEINGAKQLNYENNQAIKAAYEYAQKGDLAQADEAINKSRLDNAQRKQAKDQLGAVYGATALTNIYTELQMTPAEVDAFLFNKRLPLANLQRIAGTDMQKMVDYQVKAEMLANTTEQLRPGTLDEVAKKYTSAYAATKKEHEEKIIEFGTNTQAGLSELKAKQKGFISVAQVMAQKQGLVEPDMIDDGKRFNTWLNIAINCEADALKPKDEKLTDQQNKNGMNKFLGWLYGTPGVTSELAIKEASKYYKAGEFDAITQGKMLDEIKSYKGDDFLTGVSSSIKSGEKSLKNPNGWDEAESGRMIVALKLEYDKLIKDGVSGAELETKITALKDKYIKLKRADWVGAEQSAAGNKVGELVANLKQMKSFERAAYLVKNPVLIEQIKAAESFAGIALNTPSGQINSRNLEQILLPEMNNLFPNLFPETFTTSQKWNTSTAGGVKRFYTTVPAGTKYADSQNRVWLKPAVINDRVTFMVQDPAINGDKGLVQIDGITEWRKKRQPAQSIRQAKQM